MWSFAIRFPFEYLSDKILLWNSQWDFLLKALAIVCLRSFPLRFPSEGTPNKIAFAKLHDKAPLCAAMGIHKRKQMTLYRLGSSIQIIIIIIIITMMITMIFH